SAEVVRAERVLTAGWLVGVPRCAGDGEVGLVDVQGSGQRQESDGHQHHQTEQTRAVAGVVAGEAGQGLAASLSSGRAGRGGHAGSPGAGSVLVDGGVVGHGRTLGSSSGYTRSARRFMRITEAAKTTNRPWTRPRSGTRRPE